MSKSIEKGLPVKPLKVEYQSLSKLVEGQIINWIMDGTLKVGQRLNIEDLANTLGVSRMPIREAIKSLEKNGLVKSEPYVGTTITTLQGNDIEELYILREVLESKAAEIAARNITDEEIANLEAIQAELEQTLEREGISNRQSIYELNRKFHECIYAASHMHRLCEFISILWDNIAFYRLVAAYNENYGSKMRMEHRSYIDALKNRDGKLVSSLITRSLQKHLDELPVELQKYCGELK